jgi:RNA polymerase sigma-70 factor (ECF subfamily)
MFGNTAQSMALPVEGYPADDAALVAGLQAGDSRAVEHLVTHYGPILYRFAYYQLQDSMQAEDLVAEVFLRVTEKVDSYVQGEIPFQAWLFRIARNRITDGYRQRQRRPQVSFEQWLAATPTAEPGRADRGIDGLPLRDELEAGLRTLTAEQRQVIVLHVVEGWEMPQIAEMLNRTLPSVKSLYYRGIESLRRALVAPAPQPKAAALAARPVAAWGLA